MIILYIDDVIYEAKYEVRTDTTISFYELVHTCRKMLFCEKQPEEHLVVYEKYSHMECDVDVSLSTLFIQNGMSFYVL